MRRETRDELRHDPRRLGWLCAIPFLVSCLMSHVIYGLPPASGAAPRPQPRSRIVVVKSVVAVPASERAYAASLADGTARILTRNGVKSDLVSDGSLDAALRGRDLAFLVTCTAPTPAQVAALARFCGRGGVIRPLYSASPQVVSVVGVQPALKVRDAESVKARYLLNQVGANVPGAWNRSAWERKRKVMLAAASTLGRAQRPRAGEIHAVWDHTGLGLYPGDWPRTFRVLRANGITDIFVNVSGAGFAHYASSVLPSSKEYSRHGQDGACGHNHHRQDSSHCVSSPCRKFYHTFGLGTEQAETQDGEDGLHECVVEVEERDACETRLPREIDLLDHLRRRQL